MGGRGDWTRCSLFLSLSLSLSLCVCVLTKVFGHAHLEKSRLQKIFQLSHDLFLHNMQERIVHTLYKTMALAVLFLEVLNESRNMLALDIHCASQGKTYYINIFAAISPVFNTIISTLCCFLYHIFNNYIISYDKFFYYIIFLYVFVIMLYITSYLIVILNCYIRIFYFWIENVGRFLRSWWK